MNSGLLSKGSGNGERGEGGKTGRKVVGVRKSERERASGREQGGASKREHARGKKNISIMDVHSSQTHP